jgi:hypothetical protein
MGPKELPQYMQIQITIMEIMVVGVTAVQGHGNNLRR